MKVLIVGGVAGGASTAARLRRLDEHAQIIMFERGEHISYASCGLPYYVSDIISEQEKLLVMTPELFKNLLNVEVRVKSEVIAIDRENKKVRILNHQTKEEYEESYDKLVLSPGAKPFKPSIEGIESEKVFSVRTVNDTDRIKKFIKDNNAKKAVVVGGGFIGVEMAENLHHLGLDVSLVEMSNQLLAPFDREMVSYINSHMIDKGVSIYLEKAVESFNDEEDSININLDGGDQVNADFVIFCIGVKPETELAQKADIKIGPRGHIVVGSDLKTNDSDIYALGDAIEVLDYVTGKKTAIPLAGPANKQGRIVAENIASIDTKYKGTQGTSILKVFDYTAASTGQNEKQLKRSETPYLKTYVHGFSHANYYPEAYPLTIKLLFAPETGKIYGAQAVGKDGVDKRIDVIATSMRFGATVNDLTELELAYAPPFGSAKDPVNIAGMSAQNIFNGLIKPIYPEDVDSFDESIFLLDVRTKEEAMLGVLQNSYNIPLEELRDRLNEIPKNKKTIVYCTKGLKSYFASRILMQHGFEDVYTLNGGYSLYKEIKKEFKKTKVKEKVFANMKNIEKTEVIKVDASGLSCPGPIMQLSKSVEWTDENQVIEITTTDSGFKADVGAWCESTGNTLLEIKEEDKKIKAYVQKGKAIKLENNTNQDKKNKKSIVVFSNDLDKVMASFIIANGAKAQGKDVTMFFTFWGLNVLRKENVSVKKGLLDTMFGFMMPKGAKKLSLSKMHMGGVGTEMMKYVMKSKNVSSLPDLIGQAQASGIKFVACSMAMDVMGITQEELLDGVEIGGVATYLNEAEQSYSNLFI